MSEEQTIPKPYIEIASVFGVPKLEVSDGVNTVTLDITRKGVQLLIDELKTVLESASESDPPPTK